MTKNYRSGLCVGGPMDGKKVDAGSATRFEVECVQRSKELMHGFEPVEIGPDTVTIKVEYRLATVAFDGGEIQFWTPAIQPMNDTMAALLSVYEQAAIAKRLNPTVKGIKT